MTSIYLTNSLTNELEKFIPLNEKKIKMYVCGPTVYDRPHLGNARSAVVFDLLFRTLKAKYSNVKYVRNITDIDDKIINTAKQNGEDIQSLTKRITELFHQDMQQLNCLPPVIEPKATEHVEYMIYMIVSLIEEGFAYIANKHVLFDVTKYDRYGYLSKRNINDMISGARVEVAPFKKHPADFVLWKPAKEFETDCNFESPWGMGRPGWHIECSAMSKKHLGNSIDIHGGGIDLMFPHHENEIAQSECANTGTRFARYWIHNGLLTVNGEKMSKSLNNFKTVFDITNDSCEGVVLRYFFMTKHYRKPLDYTMKAIDNAKKSIDRFRNATHNVSTITNASYDHLNNDLNTPKVIAHLHDLADAHFKGVAGKDIELYNIAHFLGLNLHRSMQDIDKDIIKLAEDRKTCKANREWDKADELRSQIETKGYNVEDTTEGYKITKR